MSLPASPIYMTVSEIRGTNGITIWRPDPRSFPVSRRTFLVPMRLKLSDRIRRQRAATGQISVNDALCLVDRPCQRLGDLGRCGADLGKQGCRRAAVVVEVQI